MIFRANRRRLLSGNNLVLCMISRHKKFMSRAIELARQAEKNNEIPVGAVVVMGGEILGEGCNYSIGDCDPTAHAEINALRAAAKKSENYRLGGATLYVTLEPCIMCAGAIIHARIATLIFGARDEKSGAAGSAMNLLQSPLLNHQCDIQSGVERERCEKLLSDFFVKRRRKNSI